MNIYELEKLATPGPYTVEGEAVMAPTGWKKDDPWFLGASETMHICSADQNHRPVPEQLANAALLAHCRNNFMKALEALKEISDPNMASHEWKHWLATLPALIKELEEVK